MNADAFPKYGASAVHDAAQAKVAAEPATPSRPANAPTDEISSKLYNRVMILFNSQRITVCPATPSAVA